MVALINIFFVFKHLILNPVIQSKLLEIYIPEQTNEKGKDISKNRFRWFGKRASCFLPENNYKYKSL